MNLTLQTELRMLEVYLRIMMLEPCIPGGQTHPNSGGISANARIGIGSIVAR